MFSIAADVLQIDLGPYPPGAMPPVNPEMFEGIYNITHGLKGLLVVPCGILYFLWIYRANTNAHALGASGIAKPGWVIGGYFIPVANLGLPLESMSQIWRASSNPSNWTAERPPMLLSIWWIAWVIANAVGMYMLEFGKGLSVASRDYWDLIQCLMEAAATVSLLVIVRRINGLQSTANAVSQFV